MKKRIFSIVCMIAMLISSLPVHAKTDFSDLTKEHWAYDNIMSLVQKGVINGYEDGTYRPEDMVTYGEFIKLIVCSYVPERFIVKPIQNSHWALNYLVTADMQNLFSNESIEIDKLDLPISRKEMVKYLALADMEIHRVATDTLEVSKMDFVDIDNLAEDYKLYLSYTVESGYIKGNPDKTFKPNDNLSRAEMATILTRI